MLEPPPNNEEAEEITLGTMMIDPTTVDIVATKLDPKDFYTARNQWVYEVVLDLHRQGQLPTPQAVRPLLEERHPSGEDWLNRLRFLMEMVSSADAIEHHVGLVEEAAVRRDGIRKCQESIRKFQTLPDGGVDEALSFAESAIFTVRREGRDGQSVELNQETLQAIVEDISTRSIVGIDSGIGTGYQDLDGMLACLRPGKVYVIAARPSVGKSAFMANISINAALAGKKSLIFSMEVPGTDLAINLMAIRARISAHRASQGTLDAESMGRLVACAGDLEGKFWIEDQSDLTASKMRSLARKYVALQGVDAIFVDHLHIMCAEGKMDGLPSDDRSVITYNIGHIRAMARELNVPVIALAQLNRNLEHRDEKRPTKSDLRGSGAIEQDAYAIAFLHRPGYDIRDNGDPGPSEVLLDKNRGGPTGIVHLHFDVETLRFREAHPSI